MSSRRPSGEPPSTTTSTRTAWLRRMKATSLKPQDPTTETSRPMGPATATAVPSRARRPRGLLARLGPGLITGASDDDPSGIATYSKVGSQFGFGLLWTVLLTFPLMSGFQEICAR